MTTTYETRDVLAGAYKGRQRAAAMLTHTVAIEGDVERVLCRRVQSENIVDGYANPAGLTARPTCAECARRDPRFG